MADSIAASRGVKLRGRLDYHPRTKTRQHPWLLTETEWRVVEVICRGQCSYRAIADELMMSTRTVQTHVFNVRAKLNVDSQAGIVIAVIHDQEALARCFPGVFMEGNAV